MKKCAGAVLCWIGERAPGKKGKGHLHSQNVVQWIQERSHTAPDRTAKYVIHFFIWQSFSKHVSLYNIHFGGKLLCVFSGLIILFFVFHGLTINFFVIWTRLITGFIAIKIFQPVVQPAICFTKYQFSHCGDPISPLRWSSWDVFGRNKSRNLSTCDHDSEIVFHILSISIVLYILHSFRCGDLKTSQN